jgi:hypothetical protein
MTVKTQLTEKEFINANFTMLLSRPFTKIILGLICFLIIVSLITPFFIAGASYNSAIGPFIMILVVSALTYSAAKKNYASNARIRESVEFTFDKDEIQLKGQSYTV